MTYSNDISLGNTFNLQYDGLRLIPSKTAARKLVKHGFGVEDCKEILECGYSPRRRGKNTIEKWLDYGNKTYNIVIIKSFSFTFNEYVYLITHFGEFTKKKGLTK